MTNQGKEKYHYNNIDPELEKLFNTTIKKDLLYVYTILREERRLSTQRLVDIVLSQKFNHYCQGCASADNVYRAVKKLQEMGYVLCNLRKGGYIWEFID